MSRIIYYLMLSAIASLSLFVSCSPSGSNAKNELTVFAAASLAEAMDELASRYEAETGIEVTVQLAGSGMLARQLLSGAPADVFISANEDWMNEVEVAGLIEPGTIAEFARNRLVVIARKDHQGGLSELEDLRQFKAGRIAIGDPDHVPAGIYARKALENVGVWQELSDSLLRGIDVRAAVAYVEKGEAVVGIVYSTDARVVEDVKVIYEIPPALHEKIRYLAGALSAGNTDAAADFMKFIRSRESMAALKRLGFIEPED